MPFHTEAFTRKIFASTDREAFARSSFTQKPVHRPAFSQNSSLSDTEMLLHKESSKFTHRCHYTGKGLRLTLENHYFPSLNI